MMTLAHRPPAVYARPAAQVGALDTAPPDASECVAVLTLRVRALSADLAKFEMPAGSRCLDTDPNSLDCLPHRYAAFRATVETWLDSSSVDSLPQCQKYSVQVDRWIKEFRRFDVPTGQRLSTETSLHPGDGGLGDTVAGPAGDRTGSSTGLGWLFAGAVLGGVVWVWKTWA